MRAFRLTLVCVCLSASVSATEVKRALMPEAAPLLQAALKQAAPTWQLQGAQILIDHVDLQVCTAEKSCFSLVLTEATPTCAEASGPWCVAWKGEHAKPEIGAVLTQALGAMPKDLWQDPNAPPPPPPVSPEARRQAYQLALLFLLGPLAAGALLGLLARLIHRRGVRLLGSALILGATLLAIPRTPLGAWDIVWIGCFGWVGFLVGAAPRLRFVGVVASLVLAILGAMGVEVSVRRFLPTPRSYPDPAVARLVFKPSDEREPCRAIDTAGHPGWLEWRRGGRIPEGERILHVGDSMVEGTPGAEPEETFTAELDRLDPGYAHVNLGAAGSGPDAQYALLEKWVDVVHPARVVLHFFTGNDIEELDQPYSCCRLGPFLTYSGDQIATTCSDPAWRFSTVQFFDESPPPDPVRVATSFSWSARLLMESFHTLGTRLARAGSGQRPRTEQAWAHLAIILRAMRDDLARRHIGFVVSILPHRRALEAAQPDSVEEWRIGQRAATLAKSLSIPVIDPGPRLREIAQQEGSSTLFITPPVQEVHFNPEGHRRYARWLLDTLGPGLKGK
jgi:hypothetical protein